MEDLSPFYPELQPASERVALEQRLEYLRRAVVARISDLSDSGAAAQPLRNTRMSVGGIVKHLAWAEDRWFVGKFLGEPLPEPWISAPLSQEPNWPFDSSGSDSVPSLMNLYREACDRSRTAASGAQLGDVAAKPSFGRSPVNLVWLLTHMIDETAWHLGHLDLLRDALGRSNR